jgi:hypothetical protein
MKPAGYDWVPVRRSPARAAWATRRPALLAGLALLVGCGSQVTPVTSCEAESGLQPVCGFHNPEDIAHHRPTGDLLISEFGAMDGSEPGRLVAYRPGEEAPRPLFPAADAVVEAERGWGDPSCPGPPAALSPHGIDLEQREDGSWQLLVVNHGGRESVEFFQVTTLDGRARLHWRGCTRVPHPDFLNDVVGDGAGGFWATHMHPRDAAFSSMFKAMLGTDVGHVVRWRPGAGFSVVPGSAGRMPNGIERSADGRELYVNLYMGSEVVRLDRASGRVLARVQVPSPDNSTWGEDGRLLVASHDDGLLEFAACSDLESGACGFRFRILALDPETLEAEVLLEHRGAPLGAVTVAREVNGVLWLGTFAGDRIARYP